jgi:hypothetical protein
VVAVGVGEGTQQGAALRRSRRHGYLQIQVSDCLGFLAGGETWFLMGRV